MMGKRLLILFLALLILFTGCQRTETAAEFLANSIQSLQTSKSASITLDFKLEGTVRQTGGDAKCAITSSVTGAVMQAEHYYEDMLYDIKVQNPVGEDLCRADRIALVRREEGDETAVLCRLPGDNWVGIPTQEQTDMFFAGLLAEFAQNAERQKDGTFISKISGDAARRLLVWAMGRDGLYNLNLIAWNKGDFSATLILDDTMQYPATLTVDYKTIGTQLAELITDRHGVASSITSATLTLTFSDYGRISGMDLPPIIKPTGDGLF